MLAPTRKKISPPISEVFYPTPELMNLFGDRLTYIDAVLTSQILDACRVTHRLDANACLKRLRQLKAEGADTIQQLHSLYRHLEQLWAKEGAAIKVAFSSEGLIRIKGPNPMWAKPNDVAWRSNGPFLDSLYPPLEGKYRDFFGFFNEKLGIPKELPTSKWVEALSKLGRIESPDERRREALAIYKRANRDLLPRFGRDQAPTPEWLSSFGDEKLFLNHRDELVSSDEQLFANDAPDWAALFADETDISFLSVSFEEVPRIERLLEASKVPRLSSSVVVQLEEALGSRSDHDLSHKVRNAIPYLARILFAKHPNHFEDAAERGLFRQLHNVEIVEVQGLKLSATLANISRSTTADIATSDGNIFIKAGARSRLDQLANELCKLLDAPLDLADTFARVLLADDAVGAEEFLQVRRIGPLPADLLETLAKGGAEPSSDDRHFVEDGSIETDSGDGSTEPNTSVAESPDAELSQDSVDGLDPFLRNLLYGSGKGVVAEKADAEVKSNPLANSALGPALTSTSESTLPTTASQITQNRIQIGARNEQLEQEIAPKRAEKTGASIETPNVGGQGLYTPSTKGNDAFQPRHGGAVSEFADRSESKRGKGNQHRTKAGRLMSYAASPGTDERKEEDPAKAAAKVALGNEAVQYFIATQASRWKSLLSMPHNNPGFDVKAIAHDGVDEYIEVKGQSAGWTEDGVALTPTELEAAQKHGDRFWLCIVEHVQDDKRRALHLVQNPYGLTQQFRFDSGWKSAAISLASVPLKPDVGLFVEIESLGRGRIVSFKKTNHFYRLHVLLDGGGQAHKLFNPVTMKLSKE
jgi:hypothetical protein